MHRLNVARNSSRPSPQRFATDADRVAGRISSIATPTPATGDDGRYGWHRTLPLLQHLATSPIDRRPYFSIIRKKMKKKGKRNWRHKKLFCIVCDRVSCMILEKKSYCMRHSSDAWMRLERQSKCVTEMLRTMQRLRYTFFFLLRK